MSWTDGTVGEDTLILAWTLLVVGSLMAGALLVGLLVVPRRMIPVVVFLTGSSILLSVSGLIALAFAQERIDLALATALIGFLLLALTYSITAILLPRLFERPAAAVLDVTAIGEHPHAAVILMTCMEPETYQPRAVSETLREYDVTGVPLPPSTARPMLYAAERARYHAAGSSSPAHSSVAQIARDVGERLVDDHRFADDVHVACCTCEPRLDAIVAQVAGEGIREIVVLGLVVAESLRTDTAHAAVDAMHPAVHGIHVSYTAPLWGAASLTDRIVERVLDVVGDRSLDRVGVVLVGHGQPTAWQAVRSAWTEQETYFQQNVNVRLQEAGVPVQNVRLAWLDWTEPEVTDAVRHLGALDNDLIIVVPSVMPVETVGTLVDLRQAVSYARVAESIEVVVLGAWGNDPVVATELTRRARAALDERSGLKT